MWCVAIYYPKVALVFWFFGGFRCGVLPFIFLLVRYKKVNKYRFLMCPPVWEMTVHLALTGDVFDDVLFCDVFFPMRCLG